MQYDFKIFCNASPKNVLSLVGEGYDRQVRERRLSRVKLNEQRVKVGVWKIKTRKKEDLKFPYLKQITQQEKDVAAAEEAS